MRWNAPAEQWHAEEIVAELRNTTGRSIDVQPVLLVTSRAGHEVEVGLDVLTLEPQQTRELTLSVVDLPVQSFGLPSASVLTLHWAQSSTDSGRAAGDAPSDAWSQRRVFTEPLHVEHERGAASRARMRTNDAQLSYEDEAHRARTPPVLEEVRTRRGMSGAFERVDLLRLGATSAGARSLRLDDPDIPAFLLERRPAENGGE